MASDRVRRDSGRTIVILDSSAILMLFEYHIDLECELDRLIGSYHLMVPKAVVNELSLLSEKATGKQQRNAKAALSLIEKFEVLDDGTGSTVDDVVVSAAERLNAYVVTNDKGLRDRLKKKSLHRIFLRGKNHLMME